MGVRFDDRAGVTRGGGCESMPVRGLDGRAVKDKQDQQQSKATREGGVISFE